MELSALEKLYESRREQIAEDFFQLLRFASIGTEPAFNTETARCAQWVTDYLRSGGFQVELWQTSGHPTIFASWSGAGPSAPTLLFYGHYDVQPVDPLELWDSPPFEPQVRDGQIYARGAEDNKGQMFYTISALRALLESERRLPLNVKIVIEGEEEGGSHGLRALLSEKNEALRADYLAIVDVGMSSLETPNVIVGTRGICTFEIILRGSNSDLHSGMVGGAAYNPNRALVEMLAKVIDGEGRVTVPGFYEAVVDLPATDRPLLALDAHDDLITKLFGFAPTGGERGRPAVERIWLRPTFEINGLSGGYAGDGFKTVIPARAAAKLSCRLVPNQDPVEIERLFEKYFRSICPAGIEFEFVSHGGGKAVRSNPSAPVVRAAVAAVSDATSRKCVVTLEGGSIPIGTELAAAAGAQVVLFGYGLPAGRIHAPNENFGFEQFRYGFLTIGRFVDHVAVLGRVGANS